MCVCFLLFKGVLRTAGTHPASVSSKDRAGTSTRSLTPTSQLESCNKILRVFRERVQCQNGSTKRIPKCVRVNLSRTSRTDEAAERCRLHERGPLRRLKRLEMALLSRLFCSREREFATKTCPTLRFWPPYQRRELARVRPCVPCVSRVSRLPPVSFYR